MSSFVGSIWVGRIHTLLKFNGLVPVEAKLDFKEQVTVAEFCEVGRNEFSDEGTDL